MTDGKNSHSAADVFHVHLDACRQCREHPFSLCRTGQRLIEAGLREADAAVARALDEGGQVLG